MSSSVAVALTLEKVRIGIFVLKNKWCVFLNVKIILLASTYRVISTILKLVMKHYLHLGYKDTKKRLVYYNERADNHLVWRYKKKM